jgi:hypothetical protein
MLHQTSLRKQISELRESTCQHQLKGLCEAALSMSFFIFYIKSLHIQSELIELKFKPLEILVDLVFDCIHILFKKKCTNNHVVLLKMVVVYAVVISSTKPTQVSSKPSLSTFLATRLECFSVLNQTAVATTALQRSVDSRTCVLPPSIQTRAMVCSILLLWPARRQCERYRGIENVSPSGQNSWLAL